MSQKQNNISYLIASLRQFQESGDKKLSENRDLFDKTREVFEKLHLLSDFDEKDLNKIISRLEILPPEIKEQLIEELGKEITESESKALNKQDLKQLLEEYEKAEGEEDRKIISRKIYELTGQKNVESFIRKQDELVRQRPEIENYKVEKIAKIQLEQEERNEKQETRNEKQETREIVKKAVEEEKFNEKALKQELAKTLNKKEIKEVVGEIKEIRNEKQETRKINEEIEKAVVGDKNNLEKRLEDKYGKNSEETKNVVSKVNQIRAEIKVEAEAKKISQRVAENLKVEDLPISKKSQEELRVAVLESWENNEELVLPEELVNLADKSPTIRELKVVSENFKEENLQDIVYFRAEKLEEKISTELRQRGVEDERLIREYASVVNDLNNDPNNLIAETPQKQVVNFVQANTEEKSAWVMEESAREAEFLAKNLVKSPKKLNLLISKYNNVREKIGWEKLPKVREVRLTENLIGAIQKNPQLLRTINQVQRVTGLAGKIQALPQTLFLKGSEKAATFIAQKIGNQAMAAFIQNSAAVIAKEGTTKGISMILKSILSKGAVEAGGVAAAGGTAAAGGSLAAVVTAFQALPVVGQVIAVVAAAVMVVKPIINAGKKIIGKVLNTDMNGIKKFFSETLGLGKFVGEVAQFTFDIGAFLVGIPALLGTLQIGATLAPVIIIFFVGSFLYTLFQQQQISSIVPPADLTACVLKRGTGPGGLPEGVINCDQNAPENEVPGLRGGKENYFRIARDWKSGKDYAQECFNDVVNRSLCAGINPLYSLWAWVHESGASNYDHGLIQDFGINDSSIQNNFDAQIKNFLRLDPASACDLNDPKLNGPDGYWLAWASRYLTGQCDPDVGQKQTGQTGREYYEDMKNRTWDWIASVPMPKDIFVEKGGKNCDQEGTPFDLTGPTKEIVGDDGLVYICSVSQGNGMVGDIIIVPGRAGTGGPVTQCPFGSFSHRGIWAMDFSVVNGTPIYSTFAGTAYVGEGNGYGVYVDVHSNINGDDFFIRYAHMPPGGNIVVNGQKVEAGQQIGWSDNNGFSTGPHLHYEVVGANINSSNAGPYFGMSQVEYNAACGGG